MGEYQMPTLGLHMPVKTHSWALTCMYVPTHTHAKFKLRERKIIKWRLIEEDIQCQPLVSTHACVGMHTCTHAYTHM